MTNPDPSAILARAKQGHFSREDLETLKRAPITPLSAEAAAWFSYGVACESAIDFANGLLMQGRMLEAARFLVSVTRDEPYSLYEPLSAFREQVLDRARGAHDFATFCAVAAVREGAVAPTDVRDCVAAVVVPALVAAGAEARLLTVGAPYSPADPTFEVRFGGPARPAGYFDLGPPDGYDAAIVADLDQHANPDTLVCHVMDRLEVGPAVFVVEDYIRHRQPGESFDVEGGPAFACLNGFNEERFRRVFESLGYKPTITKTDTGFLVAEVRAE